MHEAPTASDMFGQHFNEGSSGVVQTPADHFHTAPHASHDLIV
jgi:hypothetical protein